MAGYLLAAAILFCMQVRNSGGPWWGVLPGIDSSQAVFSQTNESDF